MEFMQVVETIEAERASVEKLFNGPDDAGYQRVGRRQDPQYLTNIQEAVRLLTDVRAGRRSYHLLEAAMSTSDFPLLMADVLDRQLLGNYRETPQTYNQYCRVGTVRDFRTVKRFAINGGEGRLQKVGTIPEASEYQYDTISEAKYEYSVAKYGKKFALTWEDLINDDLGAFGDLPARLSRAARRTEEFFATDLFVGASGPDATFFAAGNKNISTAGSGGVNPVLSIAGLQNAMQILAGQTDSDGEPIVITAVTLVVPPALEVPAQNILNATLIRATGAGGVAGQELEVANWMRSKVTLVVNPYIPIIAATANGNTSWFLFANPGDGRPALEVGFLRGHTEPELFRKAPNAQRAGGGADPTDGDFETDAVEHKVRHVLGGTLMDPKMAYASNGSAA